MQQNTSLELRLRTLTLDVDTDGVAVIRMNLPNRPMNMTTPELTADLMLAFEHVADNPAIKGAILTSGKDRCFVAGGDIKDFVHAYDRGMTRTEAFALSHESSVFFRRIETCGKPVAAAINGLALGGGLELCLACHYRVIVDDPTAIVGQPEVTIGLLPGGGATQRLPRLVGIEKALPLLLSGRHVKPTEALQLGMVHAMVPAAELIVTAKRWLMANPDARQPWDKPAYAIPGGTDCLAALADPAFMTGSGLLTEETGRNYPAPQAILSCVIEGIPEPIDAGLHIESTYFATLLTGVVARNLMRTMFVNKGLVNKLAHRPPDVAKAHIRKLGILGDGMVEFRLAWAAAGVGIDVVLRMARQDGNAGFDGKLLQCVVEHTAAGGAAREKVHALVERIHPGDDSAFDDCDLLVEVLRPSAPRDGNDAIPAAWRNELACIHLASSSGQMRLLEIAAGAETSCIAVAHAFDLAAQLKKTPIALHGGAGSYSDRVVTAYIDEGMCLLAQGASPALIERVAALTGMAQGPLAAADEMSIEAHWNIIRRAIEDGVGTAARSIHAYHVSKEMAQHYLRLGRHAGVGFYTYQSAGEKFLWPGLENLFTRASYQPGVDDIGQRLLYIQALEAARCVEQGMLRHAAEADVGAIAGWGFPPYTGGPLSLIDTVGVARFVAECESLAKRHGARFQPSRWLMARAERGASFYDGAGASGV